MPHKYLHISSKDRRDHEHQGDFQVFLNPPIDNCVRVGVSRFTIGNTFFNITENNKNVDWLENQTNQADYNPATTKRIRITLDIGNYSIATLLSAIQTKVNAQTLDVDSNNRAFGAETLPQWTLSTTDTFHVKIVATSPTAANNKRWVPYVESDEGYKNSVWKVMGLQKSQVKTNEALSILDADPYRETNETAYPNVNGIAPVARTITGHHPYHETYPNIVIASDRLATSVQKTTSTNNTISTKPCNFLATIPVNVNRYSWIHYEKLDNIEYHNQHSSTIKSFDIKILTDEGFSFGQDELNDFTMTLIFEIKDDINENMKNEMVRYVKNGYNLAHNC